MPCVSNRNSHSIRSRKSAATCRIVDFRKAAVDFRNGGVAGQMGQALNKPCKWSNHGTTGNTMIYMSVSLGECWEPPPEDIKDIVGGLPTLSV